MSKLTDEELLRRATNWFNYNGVCVKCNSKSWTATEIGLRGEEKLEIGAKCKKCGTTAYTMLSKRTLRDYQ